MLLNLSAASIKMTYEYDTVENQRTEDTEDDEIVQTSALCYAIGVFELIT